ncbi:MAG TPA: ATP-binding cassette domain-containing protein [Gemmatimonadaceae bacterium]
MVELTDVRYKAGGTTILDGVSVGFRENRFNVIIGPNGAGKSTLLKIASGLLQPTSGLVKYDGEPVSGIDPEALARRRAVLSQSIELAFGLTVEEVVLIGRFPHYDAAPGKIDREIVERAIEAVDLVEKRDQLYPTLSGGEKQKAQLARILAQLWRTESSRGNRVLFLDEPVTGLDIHYQLHILDIARRMLSENCTVIAILHDLNVAFEYADSVMVLDKGCIAHETDDAHSIPAELIERVFSVRAAKAGDYWRFAPLKP